MYISRILPQSHLKGPWIYPQGVLLDSQRKAEQEAFMRVFPWAHTPVSAMLATEIIDWLRVCLAGPEWLSEWLHEMEHLDEKSQGFAGFFSYCLEKNRQKNSMPGGRSYLGSLFVGAVQPGWESDSSSVKPEGGDGSTISYGKSFCVSIGRGTPGCACHSVSVVQCFLVSYCPPLHRLTIKRLFSHRHTSLVFPRVKDLQLSFMFYTEKGRLSAWNLSWDCLLRKRFKIFYFSFYPAPCTFTQNGVIFNLHIVEVDHRLPGGTSPAFVEYQCTHVTQSGINGLACWKMKS